MKELEKPTGLMPKAGLSILGRMAGQRPRGDEIRAAARQRDDPPPELLKGHPIYINIATHDNIVAPSDKHGRNVVNLEKSTGKMLTTEQLINIELPVAIGDIRRVPRELAGLPVWAIDVLMNPWVVTTAGRDATFKHELAEFIINCVGEELYLNFEGKHSYANAAYVGGARSKSGSGAEEPLAFDMKWLQPSGPPRQASSDVAAKLGLADRSAGAASMNTEAAKGKKGKGSTGATTSNAALSSPSSLLQSLRSSQDEQSDNSLLPGLDGLRLTGHGGTAGRSEPAAQVPSKAEDETAKDASEFAKYLASVLPEQHLVFEGACRVSMEVGRSAASDAGGGDGSQRAASRTECVTATISFDPAAVDMSALRLADAELDVSPDHIKLSIPRRLVTRYEGLEVPMVLLLSRKLPVTVDPAVTKAKFSRKAGTLTVTMPVLK